MNVKVVFLVACAILITSSRSEDAIQSCGGQPNGYTMPIPGVCSDFHMCFNGQLVKLSCGTMYFNAKTHSCDAPEAVDCDRQGGKPPTASTTNICERRANGQLVASTENCSDFYVCIGKVALPRTCGRMHFSALTGKCIDSRLSSCDRTKLMPKSRPVVKFSDEVGPMLLSN